jgi:uncharacterized membrane protein
MSKTHGQKNADRGFPNGAPMPASDQRLTYIDWMRGLACLLMFQTHCYDSWLGGEARHTEFFRWSQIGGTFPAPLFLFLAGVSFALVTQKLRARGVPGGKIARQTITRGAEIFGFGLLFRLQTFLLGQPRAPWTDLLRIDVLNIIGISMVLMGLLCLAVPRHTASAAVAVALLIAVATPPLWTSWRPRFLPWYLESYLNGVHIFGVPQTYLFPLFPWAGFAFVGLAAGFYLAGDAGRSRPAFAAVALGAAGALLAAIGLLLDRVPFQVYANYDFWHSSPEFFLIRAGVVLLLALASYLWCRWGLGNIGFSPLIQLGRTSLLVYWVHIEFVYGRFSLLPKQASSIAAASFGLLAIFTAMLLLSVARTHLQRK